MVPLGYYKDPEKSAKTFKEVDGKRYAFIGDMATVEADGTINLLGRGSNCINTGGEKVFPEEVEEALKLHPDVADALVFGLEDERLGNRVAGVVSLEQGGAAAAEDILRPPANSSPATSCRKSYLSCLSYPERQMVRQTTKRQSRLWQVARRT